MCAGDVDDWMGFGRMGADVCCERRMGFITSVLLYYLIDRGGDLFEEVRVAGFWVFGTKNTLVWSAVKFFIFAFNCYTLFTKC